MSKNKYPTHVYPRLFEIRAWARDGMNEEDMAKKLDVAYSSFRQYKKVYSEFAEALKDNKETFNYKLEDSLYQRAFGYSYVEETQELVMDPTTKEQKLVTVKKVTKEMPPDVGAIKMALVNRDRAKWSDKQVVQHEGEIGLRKLEDFIK